MANFLYSLNASTIKTTPLLEKLRVAANAGYSAIELWHDDLDQFVSGGGKLTEVKRLLDQLGLVVPTTIFLKGWWDTDGEEYRRQLEEIKRRLGIAREIGAKYSIAGPPLGPVDLQRGADRYAELLDLGRQFGVRPVFEYLGFSQQVNSIEIAVQVIRMSGHPDAVVVVDPFHCIRGGGPIESLSLLREDQIAISHFNDAPASPPWSEQRDPDRVMPGDGTVDLALYVHKLHEIGYDRWLSLELFREDLWREDPYEVAKEGLEKMQRVVRYSLGTV